MQRTVLAALALLGAGALAGCAHVQPWEREDLAAMERSADREAAARGYQAHFWMVREGALGGTGEPGGGCGCN